MTTASIMEVPDLMHSGQRECVAGLLRHIWGGSFSRSPVTVARYYALGTSITLFVLLAETRGAAAEPRLVTEAVVQEDGTERSQAGGHNDMWRTSMRCGVNATYLLLRLRGITKSYDDVRHALPERATGNNMLELRNAIRAEGISAKVLRIQPDDLDEISLPAIALLHPIHADLGHFVVVTHVTLDKVEVLDGTTGTIAVHTRAAFNRQWEGYVISSGLRTPGVFRLRLCGAVVSFASAGAAIVTVAVAGRIRTSTCLPRRGMDGTWWS